MSGYRFKSELRRILPRTLTKVYDRHRLWLARSRNARRGIQDVFREVYRRNEWGGVKGDFCSGSGSEPLQTAAYTEAVRAFVRQRDIKAVVDLGCGDYRVGRLLRTTGVRYVGVDIVPELIERNRKIFADEETQFECCDLLEDELPAGDVCLVRQVLQHMSNREIGRAVARLGRYPYVLITEHLPAPDRLVQPNLDKPHGADTRVVDGSGVFLDLPPFSVPIDRIILETPVLSPIASEGEVLRTLLLKTPAIPF
jgi:SAM-dependent methyltransferase